MELLISSINGQLENIDLSWHESKSLCIVLCSKGYPDKFENEVEIKNLNNLDLRDKEFIFHAGTKMIDNKTFSNGGRVLNFVKQSESYKKSREDIISLINNLKWKNGFYRRDIGFKVIGS